MITLDGATVYAGSPAGGRRAILRKVSLSVGRGQWIAVVGANGAGKSTLLSVLASLRPLDAGVMTFGHGHPATGILLQDPDNQLVTSSVAHELMLSLPADAGGEARERVAAASSRFGLDGLWRRNPHRLSGGEKQRLALATVWLGRPDLVLLDEPTAFLDATSTRRCVEFVRELHAAGVTIVWVGPSESSVVHADRVVCLDDGAVVFHGEAREWDSFPGRDALRFPDPPAASPRRGSGVALTFDGVYFDYDGHDVFTGLDLVVNGGECLGVAGDNGSGKSTLLLLAGGVLEPSRGRLERGASGPAFFLPQSPERMFFAESVREELSFGLRRLGLAEAEALRRASAALEGVGLDPAAVLPRQPFDLSYGEMRRVAFAVAGALEPSLLLLDEPTACLDPDGVALFYRVLERQRQAGTAVVVASHDPRALSACDRVVSLDGGAARERAPV
jgi:energy-coupling factor transport system ATP-binding protein